jgi:hypothetical protein
MSTVFHFGPGETEKQLKFGSDSETVLVASDAKISAETVHRSITSANSAVPAISEGASAFSLSANKHFVCF